MTHIGIAADHGGFELKILLISALHAAGYEVTDFGAYTLDVDDDYHDFVIPLAQAVASGEVTRGLTICSSGMGACVAANKVSHVRAAVISDAFSAHQGVEHDDINVMCLGPLVVGHALAWELTKRFIAARFNVAAHHRRRLEKVAKLENAQAQTMTGATPNTSNDTLPTNVLSKIQNLHPQFPLRLHLIRHGETTWALSGQYTGRTDIPLTAHGEDEAREVGRCLSGIPFAHVLTSPLQRAQQTCALAALGPKPTTEPDLTEWNNGEDEGHTPAEILLLRPGWNLFRDGSPQGETPHQVSERADRIITHLRTLNGDVALFSHDHFGRVLAARWIGLRVEQGQCFLLAPASHSILCYAHDGADQPVIELWNAVASVDAAPAIDPCAKEANGNAQRM